MNDPVAPLREPERNSTEARVVDIAIRLGLLGLFVYWSLTLVAPFLGVVIWAIILTVALHPLYAWLRVRLGNQGWLAATVVTIVALALVLGPTAALAVSFAQSIETIANGFSAGTIGIPAPPAYVAEWPVIGPQLHDIWSLASTNFETALQRYGPRLMDAGTLALDKLAGIGFGLLLFAAAVLIAGFLYGPGLRFAEDGRRFARRIAGERGAGFVDLAGATIRSISRGVIGMSLLQAIYAGVVLALFGVPGAGLIAFVLLLFCIVQVGPMLVIVPTVLWAFSAMEVGTAIALAVALVPLVLIDNLLKPIVMARGLRTPMLVILIGVIGGTISYGLIGLFVGPIVLSVLYELAIAWVRSPPGQAPAAPPQV